MLCVELDSSDLDIVLDIVYGGSLKVLLLMPHIIMKRFLKSNPYLRGHSQRFAAILGFEVSKVST